MNIQKEYIAEFVYGATDGTITTFAVMAGALGAALSPSIVLILGLANLFADGFSMAVSNYLSNKSAGRVSSPFRFAMNKRNPVYTAQATFISFVIIGLIPLIPFIGALWNPFMKNNTFSLSIVMTAFAFILIGYIRGWVTDENRLRSMGETLFVGGTAALIAFGVGFILKSIA